MEGMISKLIFVVVGMLLVIVLMPIVQGADETRCISSLEATGHVVLASTSSEVDRDIYTQNVLPAADSTWDIGASGNEYAEGYFDDLFTDGLTTGDIVSATDSTYDIGASGNEYAEGWFDKLYAGGSEVVRAATIVIAASNASATWIAQSDLQCDGIEDDTEIQSALDAVDAADGGKVQLSDGNFAIALDALQAGDNTELAGVGTATILENHRGAGAQPIVITNDDWVNGTGNITLRDFAIDGRDEGLTGITGGLVYLCKVDNALVERIYAHNANHQCFEITRSQNVVIRDCVGVISNSDDIFSVTDKQSPGGASVAESLNILFENCYASDATDNTFEVDDGPQYVTFKNCWSANGGGFLVHAHTGETTPKHITFVDCGGYNPGGNVFAVLGADDYSDQSEDILLYRPRTRGGSIQVRDTLNCHIIEPDIINPFTAGGVAGFYGINASRQYSGLKIIGGHISNTGYIGIWLGQIAGYSNDDIEIRGVRIDNTDREHISINADAGNMTGLRIIGNSCIGKPTDRTYAIFVDVDGANIAVDRIDENYIYDSTDALDKGIRCDRDSGTAVVNSICENIIGGATTPISIEGTWTQSHIQENTGYVTENWGTGTIPNGSTSVVVTHGLATTPTDVFLTAKEQGTNDYGRLDWGSGNSTMFTITCSADPGVSNLDVGWEAKVR